MPISAQEHECLVNRVQAGDDNAMGALIDLYETSIHKMAERLIGRVLQSQLDAADLVQAIQLTLWLGLRAGQFSAPTPQAFLALAKTLLRRQVARYWRAAKLEMSQTVEGNFAATIADQNLIARAAESDPRQDVEFDDLTAQFLEHVDKVDQQLLKLRLLGYNTAGAAKIMQCDAGCLRVRLGRLRKKFADFREVLEARR